MAKGKLFIILKSLKQRENKNWAFLSYFFSFSLTLTPREIKPIPYPPSWQLTFTEIIELSPGQNQHIHTIRETQEKN